MTLLAGASLLLILGLRDDLAGLDWRLRLGVQVAVAAGMAWGRDWNIADYQDMDGWSVALATVWIVGIVNAFNLLDNMDGLAAGVALPAALVLAGEFAAGDASSGLLPTSALLVALSGSFVGFLWHNGPPARLFMGDAGSYFVGCLLAVTAMWSTYLPVLIRPSDVGVGWPNKVAPVCLLAVPIYDTVSVVIIRLWAGRSPFAPDRMHVSHRLVALGLSPPRAVLFLVLAAVGCGAAAAGVRRVSEWPALAIVIGLAGELRGGDRRMAAAPAARAVRVSSRTAPRKPVSASSTPKDHGSTPIPFAPQGGRHAGPLAELRGRWRPARTAVATVRDDRAAGQPRAGC